MILQKSELSEKQKAALEELMGRALGEEEMISLRTVPVQVSSPAERQEAVDRLRAFLENSPRPRDGVSDAEIDAAIVEAMRSVRPGYTPIR